MLGPEKCLDSNSLPNMCCAYLFGEKNASFAIGTLLRKPPARTASTNGSSTNFAGISAHTCILSLWQGSQLCSCLRKCKWNTNRYHNDVHCTYCKHRTKRSISGIESPLNSCRDTITVKNRRRDLFYGICICWSNISISHSDIYSTWG